MEPGSWIGMVKPYKDWLLVERTDGQVDERTGLWKPPERGVENPPLRVLAGQVDGHGPGTLIYARRALMPQILRRFFVRRQDVLAVVEESA